MVLSKSKLDEAIAEAKPNKTIFILADGRQWTFVAKKKSTFVIELIMLTETQERKLVYYSESTGQLVTAEGLHFLEVVEVK